MKDKIKILHLEDDPLDKELIEYNLKNNNLDCEIYYAQTEKTFINKLKNETIDLILADYEMPNFNGVAAFEIAKKNKPNLPFIFVSGAIGEELAVEVMKAGATDYVLKDRLERLSPSITRALKEKKDQEEKKIADRKHKESERKYKKLFDHSNDAIFIHNLDGKIIDTNESSCHMLKYTKSEIINKKIFDFHPEDELKNSDIVFSKVKENGYMRFETKFIRKDGSIIYVEISSRIIDKKKKLVQGIARDITARKKSEMEIKKSLKEKETLLKEIHHRVKNNMQLIISLLNLQYLSLDNNELKDKLKESENRIRTMSLIHEMLYKSKDFNKINISMFAKELTNSILSSSNLKIKKLINFKINAENLSLNINDAIPFALLLNEIITNSIKYAFQKNSKSSEIFINFNKKSNLYNLSIGDNGIGLKDINDFENPKTLGFQLIHTLVSQLSGKIELDNSKGVKYKISFKS